MKDLFAIFFGFPSILILAVLFYLGVVSTLVSVFHAIKNNDYNYLFLFSALTISSAMVGWYIGDFI